MNRWRLILLPFSILYGTITGIRNLLYKVGIFSSYEIPVPSIIVGNLSVGGTGKTPHVAYLASFLKDKYNIAILSRGYGRKTKGFLVISTDSIATDVGDEPLEYKSKFGSDVQVFVCEKRKTGIEMILKQFPDTDLILLDDAFQHRAVRAGLSILISDYSRPFFRDFVLPAGNLREWKDGEKRADLCIFSKCPPELSEQNKTHYRSTFHNPQQVFFSSVVYGSLIPLLGHSIPSDISDIILVTGIANPTPIREYLSSEAKVTPVVFPDHHRFSLQDIHRIHEIFRNFTHGKAIIVTTVKDAMRLLTEEFKHETNEFPWFMLPIEVDIEDSGRFTNEIIQYVESHKRSS